MVPIVTVLTTTYNRYENLKNLFESLGRQTNKSFMWLVVDDGSTDNTYGLFNEWQKNADFQVKFISKPNGGKHTALNFAYPHIETPLTFIVDSDDWLISDAIDTIEHDFEKYSSDKELCGFSYLRGKPDGGLLSSSGVPKNGMKESFCECRINRNISGDMAEVWYTNILREFPFPEFLGEKFLGEDIIWIRMSPKYKLIFFNKPIYISDYIPGGLTQNRRIHNITSPNGCVARAEAFLSADVKFKYKIKAMMQYIIYGKFAKKTFFQQIKAVKNKMLFIVMLPASNILYLKWNMEMSK